MITQRFFFFSDFVPRPWRCRKHICICLRRLHRIIAQTQKHKNFSSRYDTDFITYSNFHKFNFQYSPHSTGQLSAKDRYKLFKVLSGNEPGARSPPLYWLCYADSTQTAVTNTKANFVPSYINTHTNSKCARFFASNFGSSFHMPYVTVTN
jgi:hypothetical protein